MRRGLLGPIATGVSLRRKREDMEDRKEAANGLIMLTDSL